MLETLMSDLESLVGRMDTQERIFYAVDRINERAEPFGAHVKFICRQDGFAYFHFTSPRVVAHITLDLK